MTITIDINELVEESPERELVRNSDYLTVTADSDVSDGGAHTQYTIIDRGNKDTLCTIRFADLRTNGVDNESLLAIVADRLRGFQSGGFRNDFNERALEHIEKAIGELENRTADRKARGVEGTLNQ